MQSLVLIRQLAQALRLAQTGTIDWLESRHGPVFRA